MKALAEENCALQQSSEGLREAFVAAGQQRDAGAAPVAGERLDGALELNGCGPDKCCQVEDSDDGDRKISAWHRFT